MVGIIPKRRDRPNFNGLACTFGLLVWQCGEPLAAMLRPDSAGSDKAANHIKILDEAIPGATTESAAAANDHLRWWGARHHLIAHLDRLVSGARPPADLSVAGT
jgi:hypothetical protein